MNSRIDSDGPQTVARETEVHKEVNILKERVDKLLGEIDMLAGRLQSVLRSEPGMACEAKDKCPGGLVPLAGELSTANDGLLDAISRLEDLGSRIEL